MNRVIRFPSHARLVEESAEDLVRRERRNVIQLIASLIAMLVICATLAIRLVDARHEIRSLRESHGR